MYDTAAAYWTVFDNESFRVGSLLPFICSGLLSFEHEFDLLRRQLPVEKVVIRSTLSLH